MDDTPEEIAVSTLTRLKLSKALALQQQGQLQEAKIICEDILKESPNNFDCLHLLGLIALQGGDYYQAAKLIGKAIDISPHNSTFFYHLGVALQELEELDGAMTSYDLATAMKPDFTEAWYNWGNALQKCERFDEAVACYDKALAGKKDFAEGHYNRAVALKGLKKYEEALLAYDQALALKPNYAEAWLGRGNVFAKLQRSLDAIADYDHALSLRPDYADAYLGRGNVLHELERFVDALDNYNRALALKPDMAEVYLGRGVTFHEMKRFDEALDNYDRTIALKPDMADGYWDKALTLLLIEQFSRGWELYEWRWQLEGFLPFRKNFSQPLWRGEVPLAGKTILLHSEQGLGDTIQFCRYIPMVARLGARVILEVEEVLLPLLKDLEGIEEITAKGKTLPSFDYHCPLMSLPLAFGTELHTMPPAPQYVQASPEKLTYWQDKLGKKTKPRIGLVWSGGKIHKNDHNRSIALAEWIPCLPAGYQYISLQKDIREADEETLKRHGDILRFDQELRDFSDTAALCTLMDVVISVDTSVAHLGGALGKPTWILLPFILQDWRWLLDRKDSPWYPSVTLYRQPQRGDWSSVFSAVRNDLLAMKDAADINT